MARHRQWSDTSFECLTWHKWRTKPAELVWIVRIFKKEENIRTRLQQVTVEMIRPRVGSRVLSNELLTYSLLANNICTFFWWRGGGGWAIPVVFTGLRRRSAAVRLLRLWVRIPLGARMSVCCEFCVLSGRGLCDGQITRPEESYRLWCVVVCDIETSRMRRPWPALGRSATGSKKIPVVFSPINLKKLCVSHMVRTQLYCYIEQYIGYTTTYFGPWVLAIFRLFTTYRLAIQCA